jgi:hypothetical protein
MRRSDCHDNIKLVKNGFETALRTVEAMISLVEKKPEYLRIYDLDLIDMRALVEELHSVYFVRMFASFESSLRHYWRSKVRETKRPTRQLVEYIAARHGIPEETLEDVQEIRNFRNYLIHEEHQAGRQFSIDESSKLLNKYFSRLPLEW